MLESLESRINLSALPVLALQEQAAFAASRSLVARTQSAETDGFGTTAISGTTSIAVGSYSAISNCQIETIAGQTSPDIGYVSTSGAYVEYTVSAPAAGSYTLTLGLASVSNASLRVDVNGVTSGQINSAATGNWTNYANSSLAIKLSAGANVIRLSSQYATQYNINAVTLTPVTGSAAAPVTNVGDQTTIEIPSYSAIYNSALEYRNGPDIGYVSTSGAYVEYTINVATAGTYALAVGAGGVSNAAFDVMDNGANVATFNVSASGSWSTYSTYTQNVTLSEGVHVLRFASKYGTQYNLFSISLTRQSTAPAPTSTPVTSSSAVSVTQRWMTSFTELDITGSAANDNILVTQSGNTLTISANGSTQQVTGNFGDLVIWGGAGNDTITVDSSVSLDTSVYGGTGSNVIKDATRGIATIVSLNGQADTVTGNFTNTSFWVDPSDTVNASSFEWNNNHVHTISGFYQPYTSTPGASGYVSGLPDGSNLVDPAAAGSGTIRLAASSFWGTGPTQNDINQGSIGDCYYVTALQSLARLQPDKLRQLAVDLGDGTYAVQFKRNGVTQYVRVDGDLPSWSADGSGGIGSLVYNRPGTSGDQWASIMEKAYAYFRTGANFYASLDTGWMTAVYNDFGIAATTFSMPTDQNAFYSMVSTALGVSKAVDVGTLTTITGGAPLVIKHTYSVLGVSKDALGNVQVTLRNPWGFDGFNVDSNPWDGILTISYAALKANAGTGSILA